MLVIEKKKYKEAGMVFQKVCKQVRNGIKVAYKASSPYIQVDSPPSFSHHCAV